MRLVLVWVSWCGLRCCHCLAHLCTCCLWAVGHSAVNFQDAQVHSAYPITHRSTQPILLHRPLFLPHNRLLNQSGQVNGQRNRLFFFSVHSSCNSSVHSSVNFFPTICPSTQPLTQPDRLSKRTKICPVYPYTMPELIILWCMDYQIIVRAQFGVGWAFKETTRPEKSRSFPGHAFS